MIRNTVSSDTMVIFTGLWTTRLQKNHDAENDDSTMAPAHRRSYSLHDARRQQQENANHKRVWSHDGVPRMPLFGASSWRNGGGAPTSTYGAIDEEKDEDEQDEQPSLTSGDYTVGDDKYALQMCGIYALFYLVIAVVAYSYVFESWTIIDSVFFAVATFSTVGYGDLAPTTQSGQIFTILFAVYGVIILRIFIGIVGHAISEGQARAIGQFKKGRQQKLLKALFQSNRNVNSSVNDGVRENWLTDHITLLDDVMHVCRTELPEILVVIILAYILGVREGWSFTSTMYFAIMSASTTGYGDYTPQTQIDKLYCIFFLPLSVAVFGEVLGRIASIYIQRQIRKSERKFLQRSITMCDLRRMDTNGDNQVDMEEFLTCELFSVQS